MELKHVLSQYPHITETDNEEVKEFLRALSHEYLEQIVIDYQRIDKVASFENPLTLHMPYLINGYCSVNYQIDEVIEYISSYFDMFPSQIRKQEAKEDKCFIKVCIPLVAENITVIKEAFRLFEYRLRTPVEELKQGHFAWLHFEQKDDAEEIRNEETTLYFPLPYRKRGCIKHFGHLPYKNELFNFHRNIYLLKGSTDKEEIKRICSSKRDDNTAISDIDRFALYTIALNKIPRDAKLYLDPTNTYGIYTPHAISQAAIINIEELKI
ncbi:MAG: hypothetical protein HDS08_04275 [Bacteroides sp.]|nr:hypothetical protein [Bacteroides sp.]